MALGQILSIPADAAGLSVVSGTTWVFGSDVVVTEGATMDMKILGVIWTIPNSFTVDTNVETLFELRTGAAGVEVTKVQIPFVARSDTSVGNYFLDQVSFLPEPYLVRYGNRLTVRIASSAGALTYGQVKIKYQETDLAKLAFNNYLFVDSGAMSAGDRIR